MNALDPPSTQVVTFEFCPDISEWQGKFTHLSVFRSVLGEGGPYEELTALSYAPARLPSTSKLAIASHQTEVLDGKTLELLVNAQLAFTTTFSGADPLLLVTAASNIQAASGGTVQAYVTEDGVTLETVLVGPMASLVVTGGSAAPTLKFESPDDRAYGKAPRFFLREGVKHYAFIDYAGSKDYFYRTRFLNHFTGTTSDYSYPIRPTHRSVFTSENRVVGYVQLVDFGGQPIAGHEVIVSNPSLIKVMGGFTVVGTVQKSFTDNEGYAEFELVRGVVMDVAIPGTSLVQRLSVPTNLSVRRFNLLEATFSVDESGFGIQRSLQSFADRRSV